jgi:dihydrofolate reductase/thymidylate synthase
MFFSIIFASTQHWGIGYQNKLPWKVSSDMKFFKDQTSLTTDPDKINAIIMGRKTWESIGKKRLPNRLHIILTSREHETKDPLVYHASTLDQALDIVKHKESGPMVESVYVIGGSQVIQEAYEHPCCQSVYWTKVMKHYECDVFVPMIPHCFECIEIKDFYNGQGELEIQICTFRMENKEEKQYLNLVREVLSKGSSRIDRTLVGTRSLFGRSMRFDLRHDRFPLFTTKRVFWRAVAEELFWFLSGSTDASILQEKGIKVLLLLWCDDDHGVY